MSLHLGQVLLIAVVTAVVGLFVMESYQTTPWLADKVMRWSVSLRYTDNPERATVRGEELISFLGDLPTLFKLPTAGGFLFRAVAYRLAHRRSHARREPRAGQRSLGARFRIALVKASLVVVCTSTVFGLEVTLAAQDLSRSLEFGLGAGVLAAIESVARPSRFYHGLIGGITLTLLFFMLPPFSNSLKGIDFAISISSGVAFGVATALTYASIRKFKHVGVAIGAFLNIVGIALHGLALLRLYPPYQPYWLWQLTALSGLGIAVGALAGFAAAVERCARGKYTRDASQMAARDSRIRVIDSVPIPVLPPISLSGPSVINQEPLNPNRRVSRRG